MTIWIIMNNPDDNVQNLKDRISMFLPAINFF